MLTVALQQGINGIVFGSLYVLVALGLTLIYAFSCRSILRTRTS